MHYELIAIAGVIVCLVIICFEYIWLFVLAERQEEKIKKHNQRFGDLENMFDAIINSATEKALNDELAALKEYVDKDGKAKDLACRFLLILMAGKTDMLEEKQKRLDMILNTINPVEFYEKMLSSKDIYVKGYACRRLADFNAKEKIPDIRACMNSKKRDLVYNCAMALSQLGDKEGFEEFILRSQYDKQYSFRIISEMVAIYSGDLYDLVAPLLEKCDEYMQSVLIKSIAPYKISKLENVFLEGIKDPSDQMRIACTKALAAFEDKKYMRDLIVLSNDKNWVVKSSAIKGLGAFSDPEAIEAVAKGVSDDDWWVRQVAAGALVKMDNDLTYVENVVKGYDRYASEAVKYSIYRSLDLTEGAKRQP